jgi:hypothetical protein
MTLLSSAIFDVRGALSARQGLVLSGRISKAAIGSISIIAQVHLTKSRIWTQRLTVRIHSGRFKVRMRLPAKLDKHAVVVHLLYPGDVHYRAATATLTERPSIPRCSISCHTQRRH